MEVWGRAWSGCLWAWLPVLLGLALGVALGVARGTASPCPPECRCDRTFVYCNERGLTAAPAGLGEGYRTLYLHNNRIANAGFPAQLHRVVSVETVFLYGNRLDEFPVNLPVNVRVLHLQENNIQTVSGAALAALPRLEELHLDDNSISTAGVEEGAFRQAAGLRLLFLTKNHLSSVPVGLPGGLQELRLDENRIAVIAQDAFRNVSRLQRLLLDGNLLADEGVAPDALVELRALRELSLARNALTRPPPLPRGGALLRLALQDNQMGSVPAHAFAGLPRLQRLDLSGNQLQALPPGVFGGLGALRQLVVRGNPWRCDCGVRWVAAWLRALPAALNARGFMCQRPDPLRGVVIRELVAELEHCPSPEPYPAPTLPPSSTASPSPSPPGPEGGGEGEGALRLSFSVLNGSALQVSWAWPSASPAAAYRVTWARMGPSLQGAALRERLVGGEQRGVRLAQLEPRSTYRVCVIPLDASNSYRPRRDTACTEAELGPPGPAPGPAHTEQASQRDPSSPLLLAGLVGGGAGALVLLALLGLFCWRLRRGGGAGGGGAGPWTYSRGRRKQEYGEAGTKKDTSILEMTESSFHLGTLNNQLLRVDPRIQHIYTPNGGFRDCPLGTSTVYCKNNVQDADLCHT